LAKASILDRTFLWGAFERRRNYQSYVPKEGSFIPVWNWIAGISSRKIHNSFPIIHPGLGFSPLFLSGLAVLVESCIALFVTVNLDLLFKLAWLGHGLRGMEKNGRETLSQRPWVRRMVFLGVIVFVSIPVPGTGVVGGTVAARLVGLGAVRSFIAVIIGTVIGAYGMAMGAATLAKTFFPMRDSAWFGILRFVIIVSIILLLSWLGRRGANARK
jgi:uncharacterized membrane protein